MKLTREEYERWVEQTTGHTMNHHARGGYTVVECECQGAICPGWRMDYTGEPEVFTEDGIAEPVAVPATG